MDYTMTLLSILLVLAVVSIFVNSELKISIPNDVAIAIIVIFVCLCAMLFFIYENQIENHNELINYLSDINKTINNNDR